MTTTALHTSLHTSLHYLTLLDSATCCSWYYHGGNESRLDPKANIWNQAKYLIIFDEMWKYKHTDKVRVLWPSNTEDRAIAKDPRGKEIKFHRLDLTDRMYALGLIWFYPLHVMNKEYGSKSMDRPPAWDIRRRIKTRQCTQNFRLAS